jgi:hypothetical protein
VRIPSWTSLNGAKATLNDKDLELASPGMLISTAETEGKKKESTKSLMNTIPGMIVLIKILISTRDFSHCQQAVG